MSDESKTTDSAESSASGVKASLLLLAFGILVIVYAWSAARNDVPIIFWGTAWVVGPIAILIGAGGLLRLSGARARDRADLD